MAYQLWFENENGSETPHVNVSDRYTSPSAWPVDWDHSRYNNLSIETYPGSFFTHEDLSTLEAQCQAAGLPGVNLIYDFPTFVLTMYFAPDHTEKRKSFRWTEPS
jgi:hypothetical protein